jgi:hypothetical protein
LHLCHVDDIPLTPGPSPARGEGRKKNRNRLLHPMNSFDISVWDLSA